MAARRSRASARPAGRSCSKSSAARPARLNRRPSLLRRPDSTMSQQLAYVIITPYSLHKSRTGGIFSRLISRTGLDLVAARMFSPSAELVKEYSQAIISANDPHDRRIQQHAYNYILQNLS